MGLTRFWGVAENGEVMEVAVRPHLVETLIERWPPVGMERRESPAEPVVAQRGLSDTWIIIPDRDESGDAPPPDAWDMLEQSMTAFAVTRLAHLVAVHAAAIEWEGQLILAPGASGSGKSSLSVAATEAGAAVLSDEYALINPLDGQVSGWKRPVRMRRDGATDRLDIAVASEPLPVGLIVFLEHQPGADNQWEPITPAHAAGKLLSHTICARDRPDESLDAALSVVRGARAVAGVRGEARPAIDELLALLRSPNDS
jgi:hypothetical protein